MKYKFYFLRKYISIIILIITICFIFSVPIHANIGQDIIDNEQAENEDTEVKKKQRIQNIEKCLDTLRIKISKLSEKVENLKKEDAYKNYPAVRLNIDTPLFGVSSIIDGKLRITRNVSAIDIATGYSIKDVIRKKIVKVPSFSIANITVLTRDVKLDENITDSDYNTVLLDLVYYIKQFDDVDKFLDKQINNIFSGYISQETKNILKDYQNKINGIYKELEVLDDKLIELFVFSNNSEIFLELLNLYNDLYNGAFCIKNSISNVLIKNDEIVKCGEELSKLEQNVGSFLLRVDKVLEETRKNVDYGNTLLHLKQDILTKKDTINTYINDAKDQNDIKVYEIVSEDVIDFFDKKLVEVNQKIATYAPSLSQNTDIPEEVINKTEVINVGQMSDEDRDKLYSDILNIYIYCNYSENKFYLDNINYYLSDSMNKVSSITKASSISLNLDDLNYLYIELPTILNNYLLNNNINNYIGITRLTSEFKNEIYKIRDMHTNINEIFKEIGKNSLEDRSST